MDRKLIKQILSNNNNFNSFIHNLILESSIIWLTEARCCAKQYIPTSPYLLSILNDTLHLTNSMFTTNQSCQSLFPKTTNPKGCNHSQKPEVNGLSSKLLRALKNMLCTLGVQQTPCVRAHSQLREEKASISMTTMERDTRIWHHKLSTTI